MQIVSRFSVSQKERTPMWMKRERDGRRGNAHRALPTSRPSVFSRLAAWAIALAVAILFMAAPHCPAQPGEWESAKWRAPFEPLALAGVAMVYDANRDRAILVGSPEGALAGDGYTVFTWEWDGTRWYRVEGAAPLARDGFAMTFDSTRNRVVLFGGHRSTGAGSVLCDDTWQYDGHQWAQIHVEGPSARYDSAMAFDRERGRAVLFGGGGQSPESGYLSDTWEWDGSSWTHVSDTGPQARMRHAMAYDPISESVVLHGGQYMDIFPRSKSDTWSWNGTEWRELSEGVGTERRESHCMVFDETLQRLLVVGGRDLAPIVIPVQSTSAAAWNGAEWEILGYGPLASGRAPAMAYDSQRGLALLFGGAGAVSGLTAFDGQSWRIHYPGQDLTSVPNRYVFVDSLGTLVGYNRSGLVQWNGARWNTSTLWCPTIENVAAIAYDSMRDRVVVLGADLDAATLETYTWDGSIWRHVLVVGPPNRLSAETTFDRDRGVVILTGGVNPPDFWEWNGFFWSEQTPPGPPTNLSGGHAIFMPSQNALFYQIGFDLWKYLGEEWIQVASKPASPRADESLSAAFYNPSRGSLTMRTLSDIWEWSGSEWTSSPVTSPYTNQVPETLYDSLRNVIVSPGYPNTTFGMWELDPTLPSRTDKFDFLNGAQGWTFDHSAGFHAPIPRSEFGGSGRLELLSGDSNTFGFWQSPIIRLDDDAYPVSSRATLRFVDTPAAGTVFAARVALRSDSVPDRVPQYRLRAGDNESCQSDVIAVESRTAEDPKAAGLLDASNTTTRTLFFLPAPGTHRLEFAFDLLNVNSDDDPEGNLILDVFDLLTLDPAALESPRMEREYTFIAEDEAWASVGSVGEFNSPKFGFGEGRPEFNANGQTNVFGFWQPTKGNPILESGRIYLATFTVESTTPASERSRVPQFRLRLNEGNSQTGTSVFQAVESHGDALRSPVAGAPQAYTVFYEPPDAAAGLPLVPSFDLLNFTPEGYPDNPASDDPNASLILRGLKVESIPLPW